MKLYKLEFTVRHTHTHTPSLTYQSFNITHDCSRAAAHHGMDVIMDACRQGDLTTGYLHNLGRKYVLIGMVGLSGNE